MNNSDATTPRAELKFPADFEGLIHFNEWLADDGLEFHRHHQPRMVHNIYFDSVDWRSYAHNMDGLSSRQKCRLRWYSKPQGRRSNYLPINNKALKAVFEVKFRRNQTGEKIHQNMSLMPDDLSGLDRLTSTLEKELSGQAHDFFLKTPTAVLYNQYQRSYLVNTNGIRMTVDENLAFAMPGSICTNRLSLIQSSLDAVIEFKFPISQRNCVIDILRRFPLRVRRNSKFVLGIDHLYQ